MITVFRILREPSRIMAFKTIFVTISEKKIIIKISEMTVILRDRINDLLVANAELEREVSRLRYSQVKMTEIEEQELNLEKTRYDRK